MYIRYPGSCSILLFPIHNLEIDYGSAHVFASTFRKTRSLQLTGLPSSNVPIHSSTLFVSTEHQSGHLIWMGCCLADALRRQTRTALLKGLI
jgi:hypothetical protein